MMHMNNKKQIMDEKDSRLLIDDDDVNDDQANENNTIDNLCDKCGSPKNKK